MIVVRMRGGGNAVKAAAELAGTLAPRGIMPVIKDGEIILDDTSSQTPISLEEALAYVREALRKAGISYGRIYVKGEEIVVEDEGGERDTGELRGLFFCPFCGFSTPYEEVYWIHMKSHGMI